MTVKAELVQCDHQAKCRHGGKSVDIDRCDHADPHEIDNAVYQVECSTMCAEHREAVCVTVPGEEGEQ